MYIWCFITRNNWSFQSWSEPNSPLYNNLHVLPFQLRVSVIGASKFHVLVKSVPTVHMWVIIILFLFFWILSKSLSPYWKWTVLETVWRNTGMASFILYGERVGTFFHSVASFVGWHLSSARLIYLFILFLVLIRINLIPSKFRQK